MLRGDNLEGTLHPILGLVLKVPLQYKRRIISSK